MVLLLFFCCNPSPRRLAFTSFARLLLKHAWQTTCPVLYLQKVWFWCPSSWLSLAHHDLRQAFKLWLCVVAGEILSNHANTVDTLRGSVAGHSIHLGSFRVCFLSQCWRFFTYKLTLFRHCGVCQHRANCGWITISLGFFVHDFHGQIRCELSAIGPKTSFRLSSTLT